AVAKENGYTMIFNAAVLLYADEVMDVSTLVKAKLGM
ncbi:MAG: Skp family chaperone for outer membrane protein, partial [Saprospiraceae bacterium]